MKGLVIMITIILIYTFQMVTRLLFQVCYYKAYQPNQLQLHYCSNSLVFAAHAGEFLATTIGFSSVTHQYLPQHQQHAMQKPIYSITIYIYKAEKLSICLSVCLSTFHSCRSANSRPTLRIEAVFAPHEALIIQNINRRF